MGVDDLNICYCSGRYRLVQYNIPWTTQRYYNQVLAFTKKLGLRLAHIMYYALTKIFVKADTCIR